MQPQDSVEAFRDALQQEGHSRESAEAYSDSLITHATMCRARVELPLGTHRDFVAKTCSMTRKSRILGEIHYHGAAVQRAACEALHDLIMEGV